MFKIAPEGFSSIADPWAELYEARERGTLIEALVTRVRRIDGQGETWELEFPGKPGITGLVPVSESGLPERSPLNQFVGQKILVKVMSIDKNNDLVACSRKEAVAIALARLVNQLEEGEVTNAVVRAVGQRGVYLDVGGGVVVRVNQEKARLSPAVPLDVQYEKGSIVKIRVIALDRNERSIEVEPVDPWGTWEFARGEVALGRVVAVRDGHAFVSVKPGVIGLAPVTGGYTVGDRVEFQVTSFDRAKRRLHLRKWDARRAAERRRERGRRRRKARESA